MKYEVEKNVPIPSSTRGWATEQVKNMKNGESIVVEDKKVSDTMYNAARTAGRGATRRRMEDGTYRVWITDKPADKDAE